MRRGREKKKDVKSEWVRSKEAIEKEMRLLKAEVEEVLHITKRKGKIEKKNKLKYSRSLQMIFTYEKLELCFRAFSLYLFF